MRSVCCGRMHVAIMNCLQNMTSRYVDILICSFVHRTVCLIDSMVLYCCMCIGESSYND